MAEGGGDKNEENPFSFKKFVKKKSKDGSNQLEDGEEEDHPLSVDLLDVAGSSEVRGKFDRTPDPNHCRVLNGLERILHAA